MPALIRPLAEVAAHLPARGALLGLDLGTKTIGVATSDPARRVATGVETIRRTNFTTDVPRLLTLPPERTAARFLLGPPLTMDSTQAPRPQSTLPFAPN